MASPGKILITGHRGQLGTDLMTILAEEYPVFGVDLPELDICDQQAVRDCLKRELPEVVIHAAAITDVDGCEKDEAGAMAVNAAGTRNVALACAACGARMIYYSTDYVFDGTKSSAYVESDQPNPQTAYGRGKLAGEIAVQELLDSYAILRIGWVYGREGRNFVKTMIQMGQEQQRLQGGGAREALRVVDDQLGNPTWTVDIARQTSVVIKHDLSGIFHATSDGETTWFRFAQDVFETLRMTVDLQPCTTLESGRLAPRPARSSLENNRLMLAGHNRMRNYQIALREFLDLHGKDILS
jgi:dTDP-4-dehydrorhamnose reductase